MWRLHSPRRRRGGRLAVASLVGGALLAAAAAAAEPPAPAGYERFLDRLRQKPGITVIDTFDAPAGLKGVALRARGKPMILYLDPAGENLFLGLILDAGGQGNHTSDALARYFPGETVPAPAPATADPVAAPTHPGLAAAELRALTGIRQFPATGAAGRELFIVFDFACGHCQRLYAALAAPALAARLQAAGVGVTWLPVDFSGERTAFKAAVALGTTVGFDHLAPYFDRDWAPDVTGVEIYPAVDRGAKALAAIMQWVRGAALTAVPALYVTQGVTATPLAGPPTAAAVERWLESLPLSAAN